MKTDIKVNPKTEIKSGTHNQDLKSTKTKRIEVSPTKLNNTKTKKNPITITKTNTKSKTKSKYKYISERERYIIEHLYNYKHLSIRKISLELNRDYSTIYREIKKGTIIQKDSDLKEYKTYKADYSEMVTRENLSRRGGDVKEKRNSSFLSYVETKVKSDRYSPRAALVFYYKEHGNRPVCLKTLYNYINRGDVTKIKPKDCPYNRPKKKKKTEKSKVSMTNKINRSIEERDPEVKSRETFGNWEMDSVVGGSNKGSSLLVLTERKTRSELVVKLSSKRANNVVKALDRYQKRIGIRNFRKIFKTITTDNGTEFLDTKGIEKGNRTLMYYCHPYSSCERGSNENQNKLVRRKYPKGMSFNKITTKDTQALQHFINTYPRAIFNDQSSLDMLQKEDPEIVLIMNKLLQEC